MVSDPSFPPDNNNAFAVRHREIREGEAGWAGGTVGAMDGAIEPPGMGLRRVLGSPLRQRPTDRPGAGFRSRMTAMASHVKLPP